MAEDRPANQTGLAFYDANVLSLVSSGRIPNFIKRICESGIRPVTSDIVISEINAGSPSGEMALIKESGFLYVLAHEPAFLDGKVNFYNDISNLLPNESVNYFEEFLSEFLRSVSGSPSAIDTGDALKSALLSITSDAIWDASDEVDPRLRESFNEGIAKVIAATRKIEPLPTPLFSKKERREARAEPKYYSELKPPNIVSKLLQSILDPNKEYMMNDFRGLEESDNIKERISTACVNLVVLGFQRDSSLSNANPIKSASSARSQIRDISHISNAAACDLFITADKRCGKLAYSIYEALGIKTKVLLVRPNEDQAPFSILEPDCWP
jgi:hypothetical protein